MADVDQVAIAIRETSLDELRQICGSERARLYAILDACDEPRVPEQVFQLGPQLAISLYRGWAEREYWAIAPYLVQVDVGLLDWITQQLWEQPWGIFAVSRQDLPTLRRHFRRFLTVEDPDGEEMYFRFYDPRVLSEFLRSCLAEESAEFFGPVTAYVCQSGDHLIEMKPR